MKKIVKTLNFTCKSIEQKEIYILLPFDLISLLYTLQQKNRAKQKQ